MTNKNSGRTNLIYLPCCYGEFSECKDKGKECIHKEKCKLDEESHSYMSESKPQKQISIEFGALVRPLKKQLEDQGINLPDTDVDLFENIANSIVFLHIHDVIPDSVRDNATKKLMKKISNEIHKVHP